MAFLMIVTEMCHITHLLEHQVLHNLRNQLIAGVPFYVIMDFKTLYPQNEA